MSKNEFLSRLGALLTDIPNDEREEALRYYEDYFADAYDLSEEELIQKLGTPEQIARQIKLDLYNKASKEGGIYTESGYSNAYFEPKKETPEVIKTVLKKEQPEQKDQWQQEYKQQQQPPVKKRNTALIIILIITSPIWASATFGILAGLGGGLFGITIGSVAMFGGMAIGGIVCIGCGIWQFFVSPLVGVLLLGVGCILIGIGLFALVVFLLLVTRLIPWIIRGIVGFLHKLFYKEDRKSWQN